MSGGDPEWSESHAHAIARTALATVGFGLALQPDLIRLGTHAVFRVETVRGPAIIRVSPPDYPLDNLERQIDFVNWLSDRGFPTSRPLIAEAIPEEGSLVTFWELIEGEEGASLLPKDLGRFLRQFHDVAKDYKGDLLEWDPLGRMGGRLDSEEVRAELSDLQFKALSAARDRLVEEVKRTRFALRAGTQHGDFHTGNIIVAEGGPVLLDFDRIARGPREWDLTQAFAAQQFFNQNPRSVEEYVAGYGWDLRQLPGWEALVELRGLFMLTWLLTLPRSASVVAEIRRRLLYWTDRPNAPAWTAV